MSDQMSRRGFMGAAATGAVALAGVALAGLLQHLREFREIE